MATSTAKATRLYDPGHVHAKDRAEACDRLLVLYKELLRLVLEHNLGAVIGHFNCHPELMWAAVRAHSDVIGEEKVAWLLHEWEHCEVNSVRDLNPAYLFERERTRDW